MQRNKAFPAEKRELRNAANYYTSQAARETRAARKAFFSVMKERTEANLRALNGITIDNQTKE